MDENMATLQQWIDESSRIVFFGGAGMSTESGVPDFRSKDGLYNQCSEAGRAGTGGQAERGAHPEHRRPAPEGGEP